MRMLATKFGAISIRLPNLSTDSPTIYFLKNPRGFAINSPEQNWWASMSQAHLMEYQNLLWKVHAIRDAPLLFVLNYQRAFAGYFSAKYHGKLVEFLRAVMPMPQLIIRVSGPAIPILPRKEPEKVREFYDSIRKNLFSSSIDEGFKVPILDFTMPETAWTAPFSNKVFQPRFEALCKKIQDITRRPLSGVEPVTDLSKFVATNAHNYQYISDPNLPKKGKKKSKGS